MVGSTFVSFKRNGRDTLINIGEIASAWSEEYDLTTERGKLLHKDVDPTIGKLYTIELLMTSRREVELQYASIADRDAVYEQLIAAISPAIIIESNAPRIPLIPEARWSHFPKPAFPNEVFATEKDYDQAASRAIAELMAPKTPPPAASAPLTPKPPRKPRTPRQ